MAGETQTPQAGRLTGWWKWAAGALGAFALVLLVALVAADTGPGRRLIADALGRYTLANGLQVQVGRIDGSIYGRMVLHDLRVRDPRGVFLTSPRLVVDWRPAAFLLRDHLIVKEASAGSLTLRRKPQLRATPPDPNRKLLPGFDVTIGRLAANEIIIEPPVAGRRFVGRLAGSLEIAAGRARAKLRAASRPADGLSGGDLVVLDLDATPDADRLMLNARVDAPRDGAVAALAGIDRALSVKAAGRGTWSDWKGRASASLGGEALLDLGLAARAGRFAVQGMARPHLVLSGAPAGLFSPALDVDLVAHMQPRRRFATRINLASQALRLTGAGSLDLRRSRFQDFGVRMELLQPAALLEGMSGRDARFSLRLDGPFATPAVVYSMSARSLGFGETELQVVRADGRFRVGAQRTVIPVQAAAQRVVGVDEAVGGVLRNLRLDGNVVVTGDQVLTDDLRLRSDRLDATLVAAASLRTGEYQAALKGAVNRFEAPGLGVFDLVTNAELSPAEGGFRIDGDVRIQSRRIDNSSLRDLLGGQMTAAAKLGRSPSGAISISRLRLDAPALQVTDGQGTISPGGALRFDASGRSQRYGVVTVTAGGTVREPVVKVRAPDPKLGVPLTDVELTLRGGPGGYVVSAAGQSPYGPLDAIAELQLGQGRTTIRIRRAEYAGIRLSGSLRQTSAGPFDGVLALNGSGLDGTVRLSAQGGFQRAEATVQARNARLPLAEPVHIASGTITGEAVLRPNAPVVTARAQLSGVRQGSLLVQKAVARLTYRDRVGRLQLVADGRSGADFNVALQAGLTPTVVVVNARGELGGVPLKLEAPAQLRRNDAGWRLEPTTVLLNDGRLRLSGTFGDGVSLSAQLQALDLELSRVVAPGLGLDGDASGLVNFTLPAGGGVPTAQMRLTIENFSRSGLVSSGVPVDIVARGDLSAAGGQLRAIVRRRDVVVGRLQVRLGRMPAGESWMQRLSGAPLSGGVRYNGPVEVLWALTGIDGQTVSGPIAVGADFTGRVGRPNTTGVIRGQNLRYENQTFGTVIRNLAIEGRLNGPRLELAKLSGRAGDGTISGRGFVDMSAEAGFPMDLRMQLQRAEVADSDDIAAVLTGEIAVKNSKADGGVISGRTAINEVRYRIARQGAAEVPVLTGVRRASDRQAEGARQPPPSPWRLDIAVVGDNRIFVSGMGLESEWRATLRVRGAANKPSVVGEARAVRGAYSFAGRRFDLSRGVIRFNGESPPNPTIDLLATTEVEGVDANIQIGGRATNPQIAFTSTPALPQDEVLSRLLFGSSVSELSTMQALQLATSLNSLRGGGGGLNPLASLRQATGVDRLRILGADEEAGRGTSLAAGKYISDDVYVEVTTDARGFTAVQIEVALTKALSILSRAGSFGAGDLSVRYRRDY